MLFEITWQRIPSRIAVHAESEREAKHVAAEYLLAMMVTSCVMYTDVVTVLPLDENDN